MPPTLLDRTRPHAEVFGQATGHRFEQDGLRFDVLGRVIPDSPPDGVMAALEAAEENLDDPQVEAALEAAEDAIENVQQVVAKKRKR